MKSDPGKSYDAVAADYAAEFRDELDRKPFDRKIKLEEVIERDPYETEYPSRRAYIFARKAA